MAEEAKNIRLSKAAKEFNIGVPTVIDFLATKGHKIDSNPNTKLTEDMYRLLMKEFASEKSVKEEAEKIGLEFSQKRETITLKQEVSKLEDTEREEDDVLIIKNTGLGLDVAAKKTTAKKAEAPKKEEKPVNAEKAEKVVAKEEKAPVAEKETKPKKVAKAEVVEVEELKETPAPIDEKKSKAKEEKVVEQVLPVDEPKEETPAPVEVEIPAEVPVVVASEEKVKIIGKIDLTQLNTKTRPDKKAKKAEAPKKEEKTAPVIEEVKQPKPEPAPVAVAEVSVPEPVVEETPVPASEPAPVVEEKSNFIETQYRKLEGPKILDQKVDLSQFQKAKKPAEDNKEKRKRLAKEVKSVDIKKVSKQEKTWKKPQKAEKKPAVVDSGEIEKQIKETLARLSPTGKSKTSKHRREKRQQVGQQMQEAQMREQEEQGILKVTEFVTANELATMMNLPVTQIISTCMTLGLFVSINQRLTAETMSILADEFGFKLEFVDVEVMETIKDTEEDNPEDLKPRPPVVTVMGHVDHGKTSLLDYVRRTNVIAGEAGGITQHIGAYEVVLPSGRQITFLDTPGHEAFTAMRARGAKLTDIAIIVMAADDRIMPQSIEAINHAQAAGVPMVFAINKIDKPAADPTKIKQGLAEMNLLVEEWGGKYQSQDISAKTGLNMKELLEKVLLEAELLDLKANPDKRARGAIIESSLDKGRGYVAKILVQDGTVRVGDPILAGSTYGRVKAMYNERNQAVKEAGPSTPVLLLGLNGAPQAGDLFNVMASERETKEVAQRRQQLQREQGLRTQKHITLDEIGRRIAIGDFKELNIIVKGDVDGSVEALSDSLLKLSTPEVQVNVIHKSVGQISESDIMLASASEAIIIGFQVRPSVAARKLAENEQIDVRLYSIIYTAINEIKDAIEGMLAPEVEEKIVANLEIKEVFKITKVGSIAGCIVLDGKMTRQHKVRIIRDGIVTYDGKLGSLKRFKDDVKEVYAGQDCGLNIENFNDIKVGDIIEAYEVTETKRKL